MGIKPLEASNKALLFKALTVTVLMVGGLVFNKAYPDFGKGKEQALGENISAQKPKPTLLLEEGVLTTTQKAARNLLSDVTKQTENIASDILGEATSIVSKVASQSSDAAAKFIFDNTIGNIIQQVEKLPKEQQEKIKEQVCK